MDFKSEVQSFVYNHPTVSRISLGTVPVIWVAAGKLVSAFSSLVGIPKKTDLVAQKKLGEAIQIGITLWQPADVRTDSKNLYSAFALVFDDDADKFQEVRKKVVDVEARIFDDSISTGPLDKPSQEFMKHIQERTQNYTSEADIVALTIAYPVTIHVHKRKPDGKIDPQSTSYGSGEMTIHLLLDGDTYKPLIPR